MSISSESTYNYDTVKRVYYGHSVNQITLHNNSHAGFRVQGNGPNQRRSDMHAQILSTTSSVHWCHCGHMIRSTKCTSTCSDSCAHVGPPLGPNLQPQVVCIVFAN